MRNEPNLRIENYRENDNPIGPSPPGANWGWFTIDRHYGRLEVMSSGSGQEDGWEHVSVSLSSRTPTWDEMCYVKNLFWREDETVIQFHPKKSKYANRSPFCLHLWRKEGQEHELPPDECV